MARTRLTRHIQAPRGRVYRALLDPEAVQQWMVPDGMTSQVHWFDARVGGTFRITLTYDAPTTTGKSSAQADSFRGRFVSLVPDTEVVQAVEFETDDPAMKGEMTITYALADAELGTTLTAVHENLPRGLSPADNELGWTMSIEKLARLVEGRLGGAVTLVGDRQSWHAHRIRGFLDRNIVDYQWIDAASHEGQALLEGLTEEQRVKLPAVFVANGPTLVQPTNVSLARCLGLATRPSQERYDIVIVGAGPAGLAAAVYGSSEGLSTAMIERDAPGGQAGQSSLIENYLGFPEGLSGSELTRNATKQARRFGAEIVQPSEAILLAAEGDGYNLELSDHTVLKTRAAVIATGVEYRRLRAPGVAELVGAGIYYGAGPSDADDCEERDIFVIGGANSAGQAVVNFAGKAHRVRVLVRGDGLEQSMSQYLIDKIESLSNVEVLTKTELAEAHGKNRLEAISLMRDGQPIEDPVSADAVFIFIGALPYTDWLKGVLATDDHGFILSGRELMSVASQDPRWPLERDPLVLETSRPGVFVAGDVRHGSIKRVASAVGEGAMAVQLIHQYLQERR